MTTAPPFQSRGLFIPSKSRSSPRRVAPRRRLMQASAVVIVAYFLIGIVAFWPVYPGIFSQHPLSNEQDYALSVWFLGWMPHALAHGLNPLFSNAIFVPTGVNLAQNTESPLLGLITAPFALVLSPVVRTNLLMVLSMPVSATAAFVVLRKWHIRGPAAALGGLIYGFSPYMVGQGLAHVVFTFVPLPPFIALTVVSIMKREGSPRRLGIQLGLLVTAQYLIAPEVLATVAGLIVAAVACLAIRHPANVPEMIRTVSRPVGVALAVVAVLLAYPVWMLLAGPQHFTGPTTPMKNLYHNDLLSFVVPGPLQKVSLGMRSLGTSLLRDPVEAGGYIGVPILVLTSIFAWKSRRSPRMQLALVLLIGSALLSLGPYLAIDGRLTHIPLPFLLVDHVPLLNNILPSRIGLEVGACLAAVVAFGLDDLRRASIGLGRRHGSAEAQWTPRRRGAVFAGVTLAALVVTQLPQWPYPELPAVVLPPAISRAVPAGDPVAITYPYATEFTGMQPMLWQVEDHYDFRLLGGYAYHPNHSGHPDVFPSLMSPPGLQRFLAGGFYGRPLPVSPALVSITRATVSRYHIRLVIVDRSVSGSGAAMELLHDALGPPKISAGQFSLWADWHGVPKHQVFPQLRTSVLRPLSGAKVSGTALLDAEATDYLHITTVDFLLTGGTQHSTQIGVGHLTLGGWVARWNTAGVPNGTYRLRSVAYDIAGRSSHSTSIMITVKN